MLLIKSVLTAVFTLYSSPLFTMESALITKYEAAKSDYEEQQIHTALQYKKHLRDLAFRTSLKKLQRLFPEKISAYVAQKTQKPLTKLFIDCSLATLIMPNKTHKKITRKKISDAVIKNNCIDAIKTLHDIHHHYEPLAQKTNLSKKQCIAKKYDDNSDGNHNTITTLTLTQPYTPITQKLRTYLINATRNADITAIRYFAKDKDFVTATYQYLQDLAYYNASFIPLYDISELTPAKEEKSSYSSDSDEITSPPHKKIKMSHIYTPATNGCIADPEILSSPEKLSAMRASIRHEIVINLITFDINNAKHIDSATTDAFMSSLADKIIAYYVEESPEKNSIVQFGQKAYDLFWTCRKHNVSPHVYYEYLINELVTLLNKQLTGFFSQAEENLLKDKIGILKNNENCGVLPHYKTAHSHFFVLHRQYYENMINYLTELLRRNHLGPLEIERKTAIANTLRADNQSGVLSQFRETRSRYIELKNAYRSIA